MHHPLKNHRTHLSSQIQVLIHKYHHSLMGLARNIHNQGRQAVMILVDQHLNLTAQVSAVVL
jgi:hypothetical protein